MNSGLQHKFISSVVSDKGSDVGVVRDGSKNLNSLMARDEVGKFWDI
jgi:hypothetical protein